MDRKFKKNFIFRLPLFLLVLFQVVYVAAQELTARGRIVDQKGSPLIGVTVVGIDKTNGVISDIDGNFTIQCTKGTKLKFSFIGYTDVVETASENFMNITMKEDVQALDEVVVVGYGTQKKVNLTGAVSAVTGEDLSKRPVSNTSTMLQGQMPGLRVTSDKGLPGAENVQIRVRGQGTYSSAGSNPLVLINGVEGDLTTLDPNMIESVSVLKDAASASIYGSRAANGVILITTKNGGAKDKISVTYNGNYAVHTPTNLLDLVWDSPTYMKYFNLAKDNSGAPATDRYSSEMIEAYTSPADPIQYPSFDWVDYMFNPAFVQQHNISLAGTVGKTSYNASLSMINQPGTLKAHSYERYNASLDLKSELSSWFKFGMYFAGSRGYRQQTRLGDQDAYLSIISQAPTYMPWLPDDGSGIRKYTFKAYQFEGNNKNMVGIIETENFQNTVSTDLNAQAWFEISPFKGLTWYGKGAVRYNHNHTKDWRAQTTPVYWYHTGEVASNLNTGGTGLSSNMNYSTYANFYTYLKYDWTSPGKAHDVSLMAGYNLETYRYDNVGAYRQYYDFPLHEINAGTAAVQTNEGGSNEWGLVSGFFRANYSFKQRYLLEVNARYDGSSRIAEDSRWGLFPSFSLGWRVTEEEWLKNLNWSWLNNLKLRGSYGILGNQNIDLYSYYPILTTGRDYSFDNASLTSGVAQTKFSNVDLKWETTAIGDFGVELTVFDGFNVTFDWYKKRTYDILRRAQRNSLFSLDAPYINSGEMLNKGIELSLSYNGYVNSGKMKGLSYTAGVFFDHSRNELTKYGSDYISSGTICREGLPYQSFYMLEAIGIFKDEADVANSPKQYNDNTLPGDIKYKDISGPDGQPDGVINDYDRTVIDGRFPDLEYSVNLGASWKGVDISLLGQGVQGVKHYATDWGVIPFKQGSPVTWDYIENMWTEDNPNGKYPRLYYNDMGGVKNTRVSSYYLHNGSYFRLKNLTIGYTIPQELTRKIKIEKLRLYFSGDNLLTITKFPQGGDPERNYTSAQGTRLVYYPQNRILSFGVNLQL